MLHLAPPGSNLALEHSRFGSKAAPQIFLLGSTLLLCWPSILQCKLELLWSQRWSTFTKNPIDLHSLLVPKLLSCLRNCANMFYSFCVQSKFPSQSIVSKFWILKISSHINYLLSGTWHTIQNSSTHTHNSLYLKFNLWMWSGINKIQPVSYYKLLSKVMENIIIENF